MKDKLEVFIIEKIRNMTASPLMTTYRPLPVTFTHGKGSRLWDTSGKEYIDALSGLGVCSLGHSHPAVVETLCKQANQLIHTSNLYHIEQQEKLAYSLCEVTGMSNVFFSNSGAEANEAAIKIARLYGQKKSIKTPTIIVAEQSFHGRTLATLSATGNRKVHAGFEPLVSGFLRVPYNDSDAIEQIADRHKDVVAVLLEPIQGEGGINIPDSDYLNKVRKICDQNNWLMMLDEIQSGLCRTGKWLATDHNDIKPDVLTLAKALGNGVPIGACLAKGTASEIFQPGNHGSTYGGNPLSCAVGHTVIDVMKKQNLAQKAQQRGLQLQDALQSKLSEHALVKTIRGKGLMIGIELSLPCTELVQLALNKGLLLNVTAGSVIRLLPPLIIEDEEINFISETVAAIIDEINTSK